MEMYVKHHIKRTSILLIVVKPIRLPKISSYFVQKTVLFVLGDNHLKDIKNVPFPNCSVSRNAEDVSCNNECELIKCIKSSQGFAMQGDEYIDVACLSLLLAFVRYT
jgi:hypothetical protein